MSLEVDGQCYLFEPGSAPSTNVIKSLSSRFPLLDGDDEPGEMGPLLFKDPPNLGALPPFHYNPLHDLESLWWLTVYLTFEFSDKLFKDQHKQSKEKTSMTGPPCFPTGLFEDWNSRHNVITTTGHFAQYAYLLPECLRPAGAALERFRRELTARYTKTEECQESMLKPAFDGLHGLLGVSIRAIADVFEREQKEQKLLATKAKKRVRHEQCRDPVQVKSDGSKRPRVA